MDGNELVRRAKNGEMVASGARQMEVVCARLAVMEAAVRAAERLLGTAGRYGNGDEITDGRKRDRETLNAAVRLLEGEPDADG